MRQIKIAVVLASLALAGCGGFKDLFGSKQSAAIDPPCSRAPLEVIIARAGMACSATNPCPSGSYCNTSAVCAWACYADSECETGQVCGCDGRCVGDNPSGTDGGAPTTDLSCSKDPTLLYKIKPGSSPTPIPPDNCNAQGNCPTGATCNTATNVCNWVRECENDLRCPAGSYCDPATGRCNWDCHPDVACPSPNQTCNCSGRCVIPGTSPGAGDPSCQPRKMITLNVDPRTSFVEGSPMTSPSWTRTVKVMLSAPTEAQLAGLSAMGGFTMHQSTQTYVVPRENTQVFCNGAWTTGPCALPRAIAPTESTTNWTFESLGQAPDPVTKRATILVQVRATPGVMAPSWHVSVFTPGAQNSPQVLDFAFKTEGSDITPMLPAPTWQSGLPAEDLFYRGTVLIRGPNDPTPQSVGGTPDSLPSSTVSVVARKVGTQLHIFDATRTLSASGTLRIENGNTERLNLFTIFDSRMFFRAHGRPFAIITHDPASKAVKGEFSVAGLHFNPVTVFGGYFALTPIPAGEPAPTIPTEPIPHLFEDNYLTDSTWLNRYIDATFFMASAGARVASLWLNDIYDYNRGVSSPIHVSKPPLLFANLTMGIYPPGAGQEACVSSFVNGYVQALRQPWTIDGHTYQNDVFLPRPTEVFVGSFCNLSSVYATQEQKDTYLPCVNGAGVEPVLRSQSSFNLSANCQDFYNNQQYSGTPIAKLYNNWLAEDCRIVTNPAGTEKFQVILRDLGGGVAQTHNNDLYICPNFKRSLVRVPTGLSSPAIVRTDASPAEAAYCYEPSMSSSTLLWSGTLTSGADAGNVMDFSGDLLCKGPYNGTYAPRMFPLITHADRVARGEFFSANGNTASDLFDACLRELSEPAPINGPEDLTQLAISPTFFKTIGDPACISMARFAMANHSFRTVGSLSDRDRKLLGHVLKQWIAVHSFVSYQGLEESKLRRVLASATDATKSPVTVTTGGQDPAKLAPINYEELIDLVNQSWQPVLTFYHTNFSDLVQALGLPDYRDWSGSVAIDPVLKASHDQWLPLPVLMVEGANQELRLLRAYLEQARFATYSANATGPNSARDQALARYGATIRLLYIIEGAATNLWYSFGYFSQEVWDRFWTAVREMQGLREDVRRAVGALSAGRNPLGIDEDDLPIFFGDPQGTNSQYFASSDYLVNQWALPAVSAAESSIALARDAWLQARNSRIQDRMTQTQRDQRVDEIRANHGQKLIENCGLTGMDAQDVLTAFNGGLPDGTTLDLATCFIDPACTARSTLTETVINNKVTPRQEAFRLCTLKETAGIRQLPEPYATCADTGALVNGCTRVGLYGDFNSGLVPRAVLERADLTCQARLGYRAPLPSTQELAGQMDPACFRGRMGAAVVQILAARQDCAIAVENWKLADQSFKLDSQYCSQVEAAEQEAAMRADLLQDALEGYNQALFSAEFDLIGWEAFSGWMGAIGSAISTFGTSVVQGAIGLGTQGAKIEKLQAETGMTRAQNDYNEAMAIKQANDTIRSCWHTVDKSQLEIVSAYSQISRRQTDATNAGNELATLMNENVQALRQGTNDVKREKDRFISTVAHHYWTDEKIDRFNKDFAWARRMTYLAMRAVEYEFQQSLPLRQSVLTASHPNQLADALRRLQQEVGTRTINRRRPSDASIVLSLRDEMMALPDRSADPTGERQLTPMRGLQQRLVDPKFAVHDKNGNWLGQGIPFNLGPEGALNYRCGERLWRVTATVQGDGLSESQPGVSLLVLKRNTFASQWCRGQGDGNKYQYGSVQPSRRLFGEQGTGALESQANGFSTALLYPWFNIRRTDFYKDTYRDGASEELAGRGLYGDYILLFPRDVLEGTANATDACVASRRGFPLDQVEDVLIRFDYLSVDNLADLGQ